MEAFKPTISLGISGSILVWSFLEPSRDLISSSILQLSANFTAAAHYQPCACGLHNEKDELASCIYHMAHLGGEYLIVCGSTVELAIAW